MRRGFYSKETVSSCAITSAETQNTLLKGTATLMTTVYYMKDLYKPCILIPVHLNRLINIEDGANKYLQMDCNGSSHIVGIVTSHSLIKYA